nr:pilus assembly protein PilM [Heliobacterium chlorum]
MTASDGEDPDSVQVDSIPRAFLKDLVQEVSRSIDFYKLQSRDSHFTRLILAGSFAGIQGITDYLLEEFSMVVADGDLLHSIGDRVEKAALPLVGPDTEVAIGLALRDLSN